MSIYRDENWTIDVAYITPSVITSAPVAQATVRILISYGSVAQSIDLPADAAEALAKALPECVAATRKAFKGSYGSDATHAESSEGEQSGPTAV
jgi:RNase P/RNase MRP subunit p30